MNYRRILHSSIGLLTILLCILPLQTASAHELAADQDIGAVLHVDPDDEPVAGKVETFFFEIKDKTGKFNGQNCACTFTIEENGKQLYSVPLDIKADQHTILNASVTYTFPQKGIYHVEVSGKPIQGNAFQPFTLHWQFNIDKNAESQSTAQSPNQQLITRLLQVAGIALLVLLITLLIIRNKRRNK